MRWALMLLPVVVLASCGGKETPCSGSNCLQVAGFYTVSATSPPAGNSCKHIVYEPGDSNGNFTLDFEVQQNGSSLDLTLDANVGIQVTGTLNTDGTANFSGNTAHLPITDPNDGTTYDYSDNTNISLSFAKAADGTINVTGSLHDTLLSNGNGVTDDTSCGLSASLTSGSNSNN